MSWSWGWGILDFTIYHGIEQKLYWSYGASGRTQQKGLDGTYFIYPVHDICKGCFRIIHYSDFRMDSHCWLKNWYDYIFE